MTVRTGFTLDDHLKSTRQAAIRLKIRSTQVSAALVAGTCTGAMIEATRADLVSAREAVTNASAASGIVAYARDQYADQTWNVGADYTAMLSAIDTAVTSIVAVGRTLDTIAADGTLSQATFTEAATGTLRADLDAVAATIG